MNILVTGANGQLGRHIRLASVAASDNYIFTDIISDPAGDILSLDITDPVAVWDIVRHKNIDIIVNCAAYTDVEKAETDEVGSRKINAEAPAILARAMLEANGLLIHISTDYIFDGSDPGTPINEDVKANPLSVYGRTKLEGERAIAGAGCRYIIFRTSWLYSEFGKNFVKTIMSLIQSKPEISVVDDQRGTPTYAGDLAKAIVEIIENRKFCGNEGIYHYSGEGACTWYEFARKIAELSGETSCKILPCATSDRPDKAARPKYSVLDKTKFKKTFGMDIPHWEDSLRFFVASRPVPATAGCSAQTPKGVVCPLCGFGLTTSE